VLKPTLSATGAIVSEPELLICVNERFGHHKPSCAGRGSVAIAQALRSELAARGVVVEVREFYCFGRCAEGPNLGLAPVVFSGEKLSSSKSRRLSMRS